MASDLTLEEVAIQKNDTEDAHGRYPSDSIVFDNGSKKGKWGKLKKELGYIAIFAYIFGTIVGSGIYISPVKVIKTVSSGGIVVMLWVVSGIVAVLGGISYVELGSFVRNSGGDFVYIQKGFSFNGRKPFNIIGSVLAFSAVMTNVLILRPTSIAVILLTFSEYVVRPIYPLYCDVPSSVMSLIAIAAIITLGVVNSYTQKGASVMMIIFTCLKLLSLAFITLLGLSRLISGDVQTLSDNFTAPLKDTATVGTIFVALYNVFWAYQGWSSTAFIVEEVKEIKAVPYSSTVATLLVTVVYVLVNISYLSVLNLEEIDSLSGEAIAIPFAQKVIGKAGLIVVPILVSVSTFGASNGSIFAASRITFAAARDGYLPSMLGGVHSKYGTPVAALIFTAFLSSIYAAIGNISDLISSFSAAIWVYYTLSFISLLIMRITYRNEKRPFKVFFVVPLLLVFISLAIVVIPIKDQLLQSLASFGGILLSVPVYFIFIYDGYLPKFLSFHRKFQSKMAKVNTYSADVVNQLLNCTLPETSTKNEPKTQQA